MSPPPPIAVRATACAGASVAPCFPLLLRRTVSLTSFFSENVCAPTIDRRAINQAAAAARSCKRSTRPPSTSSATLRGRRTTNSSDHRSRTSPVSPPSARPRTLRRRTTCRRKTARRARSEADEEHAQTDGARSKRRAPATGGLQKYDHQRTLTDSLNTDRPPLESARGQQPGCAQRRDGE